MSRCISRAWGKAIDDWLAWARSTGAPATTLTTRRQHLNHCARTVGVEDPWEVTGHQLVSWAAGQSWASETRRCRRTTLRVFYGWAVEQGHMTASPAVALPKVAPARPNPRPAPDSIYLPALAGATVRERLILRLAAEHGLRRAEIAVVHPSRDLVEDLDGWSLLVHGKGGRERLVPLVDDVARELRALPEGWAFPGNVDGHLSPRWVGKLINRELPGDWTLHKFRHRAATRWHEASGGDVFVVQELLGHADPKTTRAYVKVRDSRLRATVNDAAA